MDRSIPAGIEATIVVCFADDAFAVRVMDGDVTVEGGEAVPVDAALSGDTMAMQETIAGKLGACSVSPARGA